MANALLVQKRVYVSSAEVVWQSTNAEEFLFRSDFNERADVHRAQNSSKSASVAQMQPLTSSWRDARANESLPIRNAEKKTKIR